MLKNAIVVFPQNQNKSASLNVRHYLHVHVHLFDTTHPRSKTFLLQLMENHILHTINKTLTVVL